MKVLRVLFALLLLPSVFIHAKAQQVYQRYDKMIQPYVDHQVFNGVVLVAEDGKVVFEKGYGIANATWHIANTSQTKFALASLTKPFTALVVMQLVAQGKLKLSDTLDGYLPYFPKEKAAKITIASLLGHRSGLPRQFAIEGWTQGQFDRLSDKQAYAMEIGKLALIAEPGTHYAYTNLGYFLLALVVEKVTNQSFDQQLKQQVLTPLNMKSTGMIGNNDIVPGLAQGYRIASQGGYERSAYRNMNLFWAGADLYASAGDLLKFDQALYGERLLDKQHKHILLAAENRFSWQVESWTLPGHHQTINTMNWGGELPGTSSFMVRFVDDNKTIIILSNDGLNEVEKRRMARQLAAVLYDRQVPQEKLPLSWLLTKALYEGTLIQTIEQIKQQAPRYLVDSSIEQMGLQRLWNGELQPAIAILALNVHYFADSPDAHENLSQALEASGLFAAALKSKQQALKLLPQNSYLQQEVLRLQAMAEQ